MSCTVSTIPVSIVSGFSGGHAMAQDAERRVANPAADVRVHLVLEDGGREARRGEELDLPSHLKAAHARWRSNAGGGVRVPRRQVGAPEGRARRRQPLVDAVLSAVQSETSEAIRSNRKQL